MVNSQGKYGVPNCPHCPQMSIVMSPVCYLKTYNRSDTIWIDVKITGECLWKLSVVTILPALTSPLQNGTAQRVKWTTKWYVQHANRAACSPYKMIHRTTLIGYMSLLKINHTFCSDNRGAVPFFRNTDANKMSDLSQQMRLRHER